MSVSVCLSQSVCLGRPGHADEHTHDVNNAIMQSLPGCVTGIANVYLGSHTDNHTHDIKLFHFQKLQKPMF